MKTAKYLCILSSMLIASSALASCGEGKTTTESSSSTPSATSTAVSSAVEEGPHTIRIMQPSPESGSAYVKWEDRTEFPAWKAFEEKLKEQNIELVFDNILGDQYSVVLQTKFAAKKDLPDFVNLQGMDDAAALALARNGLIIDMNEAIETYSDGTIEKIVKEKAPFDGKANTAPDGKRYWLTGLKNLTYTNPKTGENLSCPYVIGNAIRMDWLDKYNLSMPKTIDEYVNALRTFREQDANGDGKQNEILMYDPYSYNFYNGIAQWYGLPPALLTVPIGVDRYNNKAICAWDQPGCKPYFEMMSMLAKEGIFDLTLVGATDEQCNQRIAENRVSALRAYSDGLSWEEMINPEDPINGPENYMVVPPVQCVEGIQPYSFYEPGEMTIGRFAITSACEDLTGMVKFLDMMYSPEMTELQYRGVDGTDTKKADNPEDPTTNYYMDAEKTWRHIGEKGKFPEIKAEDAYANRISYPLNKWIGSAVPGRLFHNSYFVSKEPKIAMKEQSQIDQMQSPYYFPAFNDLYYAIATEEENVALEKYVAPLTTASEELAMKLITGQIPISEFDAQVSRLKTEFHMDEVTKVYQQRHERWLAAGLK